MNFRNLFSQPGTGIRFELLFPSPKLNQLLKWSSIKKRTFSVFDVDCQHFFKTQIWNAVHFCIIYHFKLFHTDCFRSCFFFKRLLLHSILWVMLHVSCSMTYNMYIMWHMWYEIDIILGDSDVGDFLNVINRSPTSWIGHQHDVGNISNLSPTHLVSNIRHQHRCNHYFVNASLKTNEKFLYWKTIFPLIFRNKTSTGTKNSLSFLNEGFEVTYFMPNKLWVELLWLTAYEDTFLLNCFPVFLKSPIVDKPIQLTPGRFPAMDKPTNHH